MEFNLLPLEIQLEILSYLPIPQVMKIRLVCKHWNGLINAEFKIKKLKCYQLESPEQCVAGYDFYFLCIRSFLDYTSGNPMFSRVKYLEACLHPNYTQLDDAFDLLNSFRSLEETSFDCYNLALDANPDTDSDSDSDSDTDSDSDSDTDSDSDSDTDSDINSETIKRKQFVVSLDRLERASFTFSLSDFKSKVSIVLDLPRLLFVEVDSLRGLTIKYPERLRTLATGGLFRATWDYSKFTNLTKICTLTRDRPSITASFLEKLPSLRELHLDDEFYGELGDRSLDPLEPSSKAAPRIFYFDFEFGPKEISNSDQWPESIDSPEGSTFIARNLHKSIDNNRQVFSIYYNEIARELDDAEMFEVMPQKLPKIYELCVIGTVTDPNRLLKFIGQFQVKELHFERTSLPQWFFEKLPERGSSIGLMKIRNEPTMSIRAGDFDFVLGLKNLNGFRLEDTPLPLHFVARLLRELKRIDSVSFYQAGNYSFKLNLKRGKWKIDYNQYNYAESNHYKDFHYEICREEAAKFVSELGSQLRADGIVSEKNESVHDEQVPTETLDLPAAVAPVEASWLSWFCELVYEAVEDVLRSYKRRLPF